MLNRVQSRAAARLAKAMALSIPAWLCCGLLTLAAHAAEQGEGTLIQQIDGNNDGAVSQRELDLYWKRHFRGYDLDGDWQISPSEFNARSRGNGGARALRRFQRLDANGDGVIVLDEFNATARRWMAAMDRNGDGIVTQAELSARTHQ